MTGNPSPLTVQSSKLSGWLKTPRALSLLAAMLLVPFLSWGEVPWLLGFFILLVAGLFIQALREDRRTGGLLLPRAPLWIPLSVAMGLAMLHLATSPVPYSSLLFLAHLFTATVFYYLVWRPGGTLPVMPLILSWTVILSGWVFIQALLLGMNPPSGPFYNPNYNATVLLVCLGMLLGRLRETGDRKGETAALMAASVLCSGAIMMVGSRSAGLGTILLWTACLVLAKGRGRLLAVIVITAIFIVPNTVRYRVTEGYKVDPHAFSRLSIWQAALEMGADHPLVGVGPNLFSEHGPLYAFATEDLPVRYGRIARKPHNEYIRSWAEGGGMGLLAAGLFVFVVGRLALDSARMGRWGPVLATLAMLYQALFHDITEVFSLMALMAWLLAILSGESRRVVGIKEGPGRIFTAFALAASLFLGLWLNLDLVSRAFWYKGRTLMDGNLLESSRAIGTATVLNPVLPGAARDLARVHLSLSRGRGDQEAWDRAEKSIVRARALNRMDSVPLRLQAALYVDVAGTRPQAAPGALSLAARELEGAAALEPHNALIWLNLSEVYRDLGQRGNALDLLEKALAEEPNYLEAHRTRISWYQEEGPGRVAWAREELEKARQRAAGYRPRSEYEEIILR